MLKTIGYLFSLIFYTTWIISPAVAAPEISAITDNRSSYPQTSIPQYQKLEITFSISNTSATNLQWPYDPNPPPGISPAQGISVDAEFSQDNWVTVYSQPAFYYQAFYRDAQKSVNQDWIYPTGQSYWVVRFSPPKPGIWSYRLQIKDHTGVTTSQTHTVPVTASDSQGFVRPSKTDHRYFEFSDGAYFPGLGYNENFDQIDWKNPILANQNNFSIMGQNGIQLVRIWLSQWQIFGETWNGWKYPHDGSGGFWSHLRYQEAYPGSEVSMRIAIADDGPPCMASANWLSAPIALKSQTNYRIKARVKTIGLSGPNEVNKPYGFVVKTGSLLWNGAQCEDPDQGIRLTASLNQNSNWTTVEGLYNSGSRNFLDGIFVTLENLTAGEAYVDYVWMEESTGSWHSTPNILEQPWMAHHLYFDQRMSYAFDQVLNLAEQNKVYLKPVLSEKNDWILNSLDYQGNFVANPINDNFYGNGRQMTKSRWLLQSWWRYVQARWGYSTAIFSWELLNEGDPWSGLHYALADEFGKYMKCQVFGIPIQTTDGWQCPFAHPNSHPVTTSTWHSYPVTNFWANLKYPNVDIADFHLYYQKTANSIAYTDRGEYTISTPNTWYDTALIAKTQSDAIGAKTMAGSNKPTLIGESGFVNIGSEPASPDLLADTTGVWLHNYLWAGIGPGGVYNAGYWYSQNSHLYSNSFDHRHEFGNLYRFLKDLPLNNNHYQEASASASVATLRAWGQKDLVNNRAHLWIANPQHTWKNVVDKVSITPITSTITLSGFTTISPLKIEWWDTYTGQPINTTYVTPVNGLLTLNVINLTTDLALKIGDYSTPLPLPTDYDLDGDTDFMDLIYVMLNLNSLTTIFDFNQVVSFL